MLSGTAAVAQDAAAPGGVKPDRDSPEIMNERDYTATDGETLYKTLCAGCHMPDGKGATGAGTYPALAGNANVEFASYPIHMVVNGQKAMPAFGPMLNNEQVVAVVELRPVASGQQLRPERNGREGQGCAPAAGPRTQRKGTRMTLTKLSVAVLAALSLTTAAAHAEVKRHPIPGSDFPILQAVEVPADATLVYLSGTVPQVADESAAEGDPARFGDTAMQTETAMQSISDKLKAMDLGVGDIVKLQVYLVAPEGADHMDFDGFMKGYVKFFGTDDQPNLPTRSVFEVAGLANPAWLVEIEAVAVRD